MKPNKRPYLHLGETHVTYVRRALRMALEQMLDPDILWEDGGALFDSLFPRDGRGTFVELVKVRLNRGELFREADQQNTSGKPDGIRHKSLVGYANTRCATDPAGEIIAETGEPHGMFDTRLSLFTLAGPWRD